MFDYAGVAVEIWYRILEEVIDLPYVLDTLVDRNRDHWRTSPWYHDAKVYEDSERQRKALRLVCRSWLSFAEGHKYRWITYDRSGNTAEHGEALEAIRSATASSFAHEASEEVILQSRPRRILFNVTTREDMELFRTTVDHCSEKVTTFYARCVSGYEDEIVDYMVQRRSKLPMLRCLALSLPTHSPNPFRLISTAFPNLLTLDTGGLWSYWLNDNDSLVLPDLEMLGLDVSAFSAGSLRNWHLPGMTHLSTPLGQHGIGDALIILEPIKSLGANLLFLNIFRVKNRIRIPVEFWTWCPCLVELLTFLSWTYLDTAAPAGHPLKYVVHWPHYDATWVPLLTGNTSEIAGPAALRSLTFLPPKLELFVVWHTWSEYLELLGHGYDRSQQEGFLVRMNEICVGRSVRVEDQNQVGLDEFLEFLTLGKIYDIA